MVITFSVIFKYFNPVPLLLLKNINKLASPAAGINSGALRLAMGVWIRDSSPDIVCFSGGREDGNINGTEASWGPWNCRCVPFITHIQFRFVLQLQRRRRQFWDSRNQDECILMATGLANLHNHCHGLWIYRKLCGHLSHEPMAHGPQPHLDAHLKAPPTSTPTWSPLPNLLTNYWAVAKCKA